MKRATVFGATGRSGTTIFIELDSDCEIVAAVRQPDDEARLPRAEHRIQVSCHHHISILWDNVQGNSPGGPCKVTKPLFFDRPSVTPTSRWPRGKPRSRPGRASG